MWLGLESQECHWNSGQPDAELSIHAETYENQINVLGKWTSAGGTMSRPAWSDASGVMCLPKEVFVAPPGWSFDGDWFVNPEPSLKYDEDSGRTKYLEEVFENHGRYPGGSWGPASQLWSDVRGDLVVARDEIPLPAGWQWEDLWKIDLNRAVDEEGWEYAVEPTLGGYGAVEKTYHLCRRRRWIRERRCVPKLEDIFVSSKPSGKRLSVEEDGGWEYARVFQARFHAKERRMDFARRRRWHRKLVAAEAHAPLPFSLVQPNKQKEGDDKMSLRSCPRLFLSYKENNRFQLRSYIYQARGLPAADKNGLSDPYAYVAFMNQSQKTETLTQSLCPTWDQTLIFDDITFYGDVQNILKEPPPVVVEVYDFDSFGKDEFLARAIITPKVSLDLSVAQPPRLAWYTLWQGPNKCGELLAAFELLLVENQDLPISPPKRGDLYIVPMGIRPVLQRMAVEVLCWGIRNMRTFEFAHVNNASVEFECGDHVIESAPLKNARHCPNYEDPILYMEMMLPQEEIYMPPIHIRVRDHRQFGRKPIVGTHVIRSLHEYRCRPVYSSKAKTTQETDGKEKGAQVDGHVVLEMESAEEETPDSVPEETPKEQDQAIDWWSKFYASIGETHKAGKYLDMGFDTVEVYPTELEKVEKFGGFVDILRTYPLSRGKKKDLEESGSVGQFKGTFRVYPLPADPQAPMPQRALLGMPTSSKQDILVRVYIIRARNLAPMDPNGLADPYVSIKLGKKKQDSLKRYKPNTLNPLFGDLFEFQATLPLDKDLVISVYDHDLIGKDDLIGRTTVDLENRCHTRHRAMCGIPKSYHTSGPNCWRETKTPSQILADVCQLQNLPSPYFAGKDTVVLDDKTYRLTDFENERFIAKPHHGPAKERLSLHVLNTLNLVSEHVETRTLYNPAMPGVSQGKLQMWVDTFPLSMGKPGPSVDISPRAAIDYELRIVIWNTYDVPLDETNILGEKMSDIYVKGWLVGMNKKQKTDVHYRSLDGEGNFNWRLVFPFKYIPAENRMVVEKKKHFWSLDVTRQHLLPRLRLELWDNDTFSADDFLGSLEVDLTRLPRPAKSASKCGLRQLSSDDIDHSLAEAETKSLASQESVSMSFVNLFEKKHVSGLWPCMVKDPEEGAKLAGKIQMDMEILSSEEVAAKPAGKGRDEPNQNPALEPPNRPDTSLAWFKSPWKAFKMILWRRYKWYCLTLFLIILAVLLVVLFIYAFPGALANKLLGG